MGSHKRRGASNLWHIDCLFNRLARLITKKTPKLCILRREPPLTSHRVINTESVSVSWRHYHRPWSRCRCAVRMPDKQSWAVNLGCCYSGCASLGQGRGGAGSRKSGDTRLRWRMPIPAIWTVHNYLIWHNTLKAFIFIVLHTMRAIKVCTWRKHDFTKIMRCQGMRKTVPSTDTSCQWNGMAAAGFGLTSATCVISQRYKYIQPWDLMRSFDKVSYPPLKWALCRRHLPNGIHPQYSLGPSAPMV